MKLPAILALAFVLLGGSAIRAQGPPRASLSEAEVTKLRNTQDPSGRIKVYLDLMQARLAKFDEFRIRPVNPQVKMGKFLDEVLGQYIDLNDEVKDWIDFQYTRHGDMRSGLRALLDHGPKQLEELRHAQQTPDSYASHYADRLQDAVADLEDTLNGATAALSGQEKTLGELKQKEKVAGKQSKSEIKQEKKRIKEEKKLRERERKHEHDQN